jgi:hypothetical protein
MKSLKLMLIFGITVSGVSQTQPARKPSFDVVSIKLNKSGGPPRRTGTEGKRFIVENVPLMLLIQLAYRPLDAGLLREHVIGGPSWLDTDRFDIRSSCGVTLGDQSSTKRISKVFSTSVFNSLLKGYWGILISQVFQSSPRFKNSLV